MINGVQHNVFARRFFMIEHAYFIISQTVFRPPDFVIVSPKKYKSSIFSRQ